MFLVAFSSFFQHVFLWAFNVLNVSMPFVKLHFHEHKKEKEIRHKTGTKCVRIKKSVPFVFNNLLKWLLLVSIPKFAPQNESAIDFRTSRMLNSFIAIDGSFAITFQMSTMSFGHKKVCKSKTRILNVLKLFSFVNNWTAWINFSRETLKASPIIRHTRKLCKMNAFLLKC